MFRIINVIPILLEYLKHLREDLNIIPLITNILLLPFLFTFLFCSITNINNLENFFSSIRNINAIILPLLINILMIVQYSIGKSHGNKDRIRYLKHIKSTISVSILISLALIILSYFVNRYIYYIALYLFFLLLINFLIILKRINLLIDLETED